MDERDGPQQIRDEFRAVDPKHAAQRSHHLAQRSIQRALHDLKLVEKGAEFDERGILRPTQEQKEALFKKAGLQHSASDVEAIETPEQSEISPERLNEIIDSSIYMANPYITGQENVYHNGLNGDKNATIFDQLRYHFPSERIEKPFTDANVSELVTVAEGSQFEAKNGQRLGRAEWPGGLHKGEPLYAVQYMTLTANTEPVPDDSAPRGVRHKQKYEYLENQQGHLDKLSDQELAAKGLSRDKLEQMKQNNRLSEFSYTLLLPETLAKELGQAMIANPQLARELGDKLVHKPDAHLYSNYDLSKWEMWKPPYEKWKQTNGGVNRIAFRTTSDQSVDQSKIVEF
jgi:hypothetical protein